MSDTDKDLEENLGSVGSRLATPPSDVKELHLLLDEVETLLVKVDQSPIPSMYNTLRPAMNSLVSKELTGHLNMDVKVAVASCISEITRITAPEAPYDDDLMRDVFRLIVESFKGLDEISSPSYHRRTSILETVAKVRSCLVMLDLQCDKLIIEMFHHFLATIREDHSENVFTLMETIMTLVLGESEDISTELIKDLLACVKNDNKDVLPVTRTLVEHVIGKCSEKLKPYLLDVIISTGASSSDYSSIVDSICQENSEAHKNNNNQNTTGECVDEDIKSSETTISQELTQRPEEMESEVGCPEVVHTPTRKSDKSPISNGNICTVNEQSLDSVKDAAEVPRKLGKHDYDTADNHLVGKKNSDHLDDGSKTMPSDLKEDSIVHQVVNETVASKGTAVNLQVDNLSESNEKPLKKEGEVLSDTETKSPRPLPQRENDTTTSEFKESQTQSGMPGEGNITTEKDEGEQTNKVHNKHVDELSDSKEKPLSSADIPLNKEGEIMRDTEVKSPRLSRRKKNKTIDESEKPLLRGMSMKGSIPSEKDVEGEQTNKVDKYVDDSTDTKEKLSSLAVIPLKYKDVVLIDTEVKSSRLSRRIKDRFTDESKKSQTHRGMPQKGILTSEKDAEGKQANKVDMHVDDSTDTKEKLSSLAVIPLKNKDEVLTDTEVKSSRLSRRIKDRSTDESKKSQTQMGMAQKGILTSEKDAEGKQANKVDMHVEGLSDSKEKPLGSSDISLKKEGEVFSDTEAKTLRLPRRKKDKTTEGSKKSQMQRVVPLKGSNTSEKDAEGHQGSKLDKHVDVSSDSKEKQLSSADIPLKKGGVLSDTEAKSPRLSRRIKDKTTDESKKTPKQRRPRKGDITYENDAEREQTNKVDNHATDLSGSKEKPLNSLEILSDIEAKSPRLSGRKKKENADKSKNSQTQGRRPRKGSITSEKDSEGVKTNKEMTHVPKKKNIKSKEQGSSRKRLKTSSKKRAQDSEEISNLPLGVADLDEKLIGTNIRVWWPDDSKFYDGIVDSYSRSKRKHTVLYADGDVEVLFLQNERWEIVDNDKLCNEDADSETPNLPKIPSRKKAKIDLDSAIAMKQDNDDTTPLAKLKAKCGTKSSKSRKAMDEMPKATNESQSEGNKTVTRVDTPKIGNKSKYSTPKSGSSKGKNVAVKSGSKSSKIDVIPEMESNPAEDPEGGVAKAKDNGGSTPVVGDTKSNVNDGTGKRKNLLLKTEEAEGKKSDGSKKRRRKH